jgi:hypothetical protein
MLHRVVGNRSVGTALKVVPNIPQRLRFSLNERVRVIHELRHGVSKYEKQFFLPTVTDDRAIIKNSMLFYGELDLT